MNENWCALYIATQLEVTPERAFELFEKGEKASNKWVTPDDIEDMKKLKEEGLTYKELSKIYGLRLDILCGYVKGKRRKLERR